VSVLNFSSAEHSSRTKIPPVIIGETGNQHRQLAGISKLFALAPQALRHRFSTVLPLTMKIFGLIMTNKDEKVKHLIVAVAFVNDHAER
jgi:hypothetical protein